MMDPSRHAAQKRSRNAGDFGTTRGQRSVLQSCAPQQRWAWWADSAERYGAAVWIFGCKKVSWLHTAGGGRRLLNHGGENAFRRCVGSSSLHGCGHTAHSPHEGALARICRDTFSFTNAFAFTGVHVSCLLAQLSEVFLQLVVAPIDSRVSFADSSFRS